MLAIAVTHTSQVPWPLHSLTVKKAAWDATGSCLVLFFSSNRGTKARACGCKTAPGKQVETAAKQP